MPSDGPHGPGGEIVDAPGWTAIDTYVGSRYPGQTPHQFSSRTAYDLDSQSPLPAITVWESHGPPCWLYITYGLTELFDKSSPDPNVSGFGFELSMRVPRADGESQPPVWPLRLLQALGHNVLTTRSGFDSGHCIDLGGPMRPDAPTVLAGLVCVPDPFLGKFDGPFGSILFLQVVGLSRSELELFTDWELPEVVGAIAELDSSGLTDPARGDWMADEQKAKILRRYKVGLKL